MNVQTLFSLIYSCSVSLCSFLFSSSSNLLTFYLHSPTPLLPSCRLPSYISRFLLSTSYFLLPLPFLTPPFPSLWPLQVFWALQLVTVLVPGAVFHLYAACKNIDQEEILERPIYTVFYIISVLLRIILEVVAFWLQSHLFGFQVCIFVVIQNLTNEPNKVLLHVTVMHPSIHVQVPSLTVMVMVTRQSTPFSLFPREIPQVLQRRRRRNVLPGQKM